jgi:hypothetical protein
MIEHGRIASGHLVGHLLEIVGESCANAAGNKPRNCRPKAWGIVGPNVSAPKTLADQSASFQLAVNNQPAVLNGERIGWVLNEGRPPPL